MADELLKHLYDIREATIEEDLGKLLEDVERLMEEEHRTNGCPSPVIH